jgi:membrane protease YdiL (CAAX protease family)
MLTLLSLLFTALLSLILVVEGLRGQRVYRRLKVDLEANVPDARVCFYASTLRFEVVTGGLAAAVLGLNHGLPATGLERLPFFERFAVLAHAGAEFWSGFLMSFGVSAGLAWWISRKRAPRPRGSLARWLLPDFDALLPRTAREGWWFALVALSAGVCEELVFRGWLLQVLTRLGGLQGLVLLAVAALIFGLMHAYQGPLGVLSTTALAVALIGVTVMTGSLLVPMALHVLLDLRWALPRGQVKLAPSTPAT